MLYKLKSMNRELSAFIVNEVLSHGFNPNPIWRNVYFLSQYFLFFPFIIIAFILLHLKSEDLLLESLKNNKPFHLRMYFLAGGYFGQLDFGIPLLQAALMVHSIKIIQEVLRYINFQNPSVRLKMINTPDKNGVTALNITAYNGDTHHAKELLDCVLKKEQVHLFSTNDKAGYTPYHVASLRHKHNIINLFNNYHAPTPPEISLPLPSRFKMSKPKPGKPKHFTFEI